MYKSREGLYRVGEISDVNSMGRSGETETCALFRASELYRSDGLELWCELCSSPRERRIDTRAENTVTVTAVFTKPDPFPFNRCPQVPSLCNLLIQALFCTASILFFFAVFKGGVRFFPALLLWKSHMNVHKSISVKP